MKEAGKYSYEAIVSSGSTGSGFSLGLVDEKGITNLCKVSVPKTGDDWNTYQSVKGELSQELSEGQKILRITIDAPYCNIDKIMLKCTQSAAIDMVSVRKQKDGSSTYNLAGQKIGAEKKGIVIRNGKKLFVK